MKCKQAILFEQGKLEEKDWQVHAAVCSQCQQTLRLHEAISAALIPPTAPAELVEQVFAKTTRRKSWLVRWRTALAGGVVAVLVGIGLVYNLSHPRPFSAPELVSYMQLTGQDEYSTFLTDLDIFEQEF